MSSNAIASSSTSQLGPNSYMRNRYDKQPASTAPPVREQDRSAKRNRTRTRRKSRNAKWFWIQSAWKAGGAGWVAEGFRRFGEHCARNQIRTLLIDCLVMTNLFYPSLALYQQKHAPRQDSSTSVHFTSFSDHMSHDVGGMSIQRDRPYSILGTPILDTFFPYPAPLLPRLNWNGWWGRDTGQNDGDGARWTAVRPSTASQQLWAISPDEEIRFMRVAWADVGDVLDRRGGIGELAWIERDHQIVRFVRDMAEEWENGNLTNGQSCVRHLTPHHQGSAPFSQCYIISPSPIPNDGESNLTTVSTIAPEIEAANAIEAGGIYHSLAIPFRIQRNSSANFHSLWVSSMIELGQHVDGQVFAEPQSGGDVGNEWFLSYASRSTPDGQKTTVPSTSPTDVLSPSPPRFVLFLYFVLFTTLIAQLSNASKVHSRFGLAFTGVVQLCCSSVMSFSVLALLRWNGWGASSSPSSLPTYVLPFVIVVVGAENMSTLTKAIFSIPFTYSVPVRIGLGLSKVGTTIALTSLTDLLLLGVVWLCVNLQPVREFCLFAAVVIITDWFMLHTFFLTVLSIDAQRLELADVLTSNGVAPISPARTEMKEEGRAEGRITGFSWRKVLRTRTTRSASLVLLLITVGILYWLTERGRIHLETPASVYGYIPPSDPSSLAASASSIPSPLPSSASEWNSFSEAERFWRAINTQGWLFSRIVVPAASIIVLPKAGHAMRPIDIRKLSLSTRRRVVPRFKPLFYLFRFVILPQALTAGALYTLLLYLLKDADLLDAQRNRLGRIDDTAQEGQHDTGNDRDTALVNSLFAQMLPCSHESDIEMIVSSQDGRLALSVAIDNSVCLWRFREGGCGSGTREPLQIPGLSSDDPIISATVSEDRRHVAVCTQSGALQIWDVPEDEAAMPLALQRVSIFANARVMDIAFDEQENGARDPFKVTPPDPRGFKKVPNVLIALSDGSVLSSSSRAKSSGATIIPPFSPAQGSLRAYFVRSNDQLSFTVITPDSLIIWRKVESNWSSTVYESTRKDDRMTAVSSSSGHGMVAIGYRSGCIELYDETAGPLVSIAEELSLEPVRKVEIVRPAYSKCSRCRSTTDGWFVISSTATQVFVDRISTKSSNMPFCRCAIRRGSSLDDLNMAIGRSTSSYISANGNGNGKEAITTIVIPPLLIRRPNPSIESPRKSPALLPPVSNGEFPLSSHGGARRLSNLHKDDSSSQQNQSQFEASLFMSTPSTLQKRPTSPPYDRVSSPISPNGANTNGNGEMEVTPLGSILSSSNGNWVLSNNVSIGLRRNRDGIDDSQWQIWSLNFKEPWNGQSLNLQTIEFDNLLLNNQEGTISSSSNAVSVSMRDRRTERLLSLNGQASFPERHHPQHQRMSRTSASTSTSTNNNNDNKIGGSLSVRTFPSLGYVSIDSMSNLGQDGIILALGNRLGVLALPTPSPPPTTVIFGNGKEASGSGIGSAGSTLTPGPGRIGMNPITPPPPRAFISATNNPNGTRADWNVNKFD